MYCCLLAREAASRPAMAALLQGQSPAPTERLHRNVAWHAETLPGQDASPLAWRRAQRGPRLGPRAAGVAPGPPAFRHLLASVPTGHPPVSLPGEVWHCQVFEGWQSRLAMQQTARVPLASSPATQQKACKSRFALLSPSQPPRSVALDLQPAASRASSFSQQPQDGPQPHTADKHNTSAASPPPAFLQLQACLKRAERVLARPIPAMSSAFQASHIGETDTAKKTYTSPGSLAPGICWCGCWVWPTRQPQSRLQPTRPSASSSPAPITSFASHFLAPSSESHFSSCKLGLPQIAMSADAQQHCQQQ